jgi:acetyl-CoA carboxylase carboxyltransferase component
MSVLKSLTSADVSVFKANAEAYEGLLLELRERSAEARRGGGEQAANVLRTVQEDSLRREGKEMTDEEREEFMRPILEKYEREGNPYHSTARLWDDGVIDPIDTRMALALGLSAAANAPFEVTRYGIFRM